MVRMHTDKGKTCVCDICGFKTSEKMYLARHMKKHQGVSCDLFLGRTHAPRTSRLRCARTCVRTFHLKWSHFTPAPALLIKNFFNIF